jgi:hypothetical protein
VILGKDLLKQLNQIPLWDNKQITSR